MVHIEAGENSIFWGIEADMERATDHLIREARKLYDDPKYFPTNISFQPIGENTLWHATPLVWVNERLPEAINRLTSIGQIKFQIYSRNKSIETPLDEFTIYLGYEGEAILAEYTSSTDYLSVEGEKLYNILVANNILKLV